MTTSSNLVRFQPRHAAKAAENPVRRWQRQVAAAQQKAAKQRRLPLTQAQAQTMGRG
jgi:hypothetical protein